MTLQRQSDAKKKERFKRATVYFDSDIHQALRLRAAESGSSISQLVNDALLRSLADDAHDLDAFLLHRNEATISFEQFICNMRRRGRI